MSEKPVTIHQPDFMPWLGFFVKVLRSGTFVVLDHVQNNVKDGSWFRRVRFQASGKPSWVSVPLDRPESGPFLPLNEMKVSGGVATTRLFEKYKKTIQQTYARAPYFDEFFPLFSAYMDSETASLMERNMAFNMAVLDLLEFEGKVVYSSQLGLTSSSNQLLIDILKATDAKTYLCGDGADGYQDDTLFEDAGISVVRNNFKPVPYPQVGTKEFLPGLSILDALFNLGAAGTRALIVSQDRL